ncbi:PA0069 family radical SAM protein [Microbulbifer magnicolonia]|uniref:PA0069 family radical SAM protein n=1 Tax=Microbulbifer magnicolonia TaxID=3109744 RepID=UPI002B407305|nr:PA0069 family radical SAM protein [Microbulbifer sp. GG15]
MANEDSGNPAQIHKGRGAASNLAGRFVPHVSTREYDGWQTEAEPLERLLTEAIEEKAKTIIASNSSPDLPFSQSINPYRGCEHGCVYCLSGDTRILYADGRHRPLSEVKVGDRIIGTVRKGWYRRFVETEVLAHWSTVKPAYRITLADGTQLVASGDHRFLTERGWKYVTDTENGSHRRAHLTTNNKMMGTGRFAQEPVKTEDYRRGYLSGMIRGDGTIGTYRYRRSGRKHGNIHLFRLALTDEEGLQRSRKYLKTFGVQTHETVFSEAMENRQAMKAIRTNARSQVQQIREIIEWPTVTSDDWCKGFLAGIFDAEGNFSKKNTLRIPNSDPEIIDQISKALDQLGFDFALEAIERKEQKSLTVVRLRGGVGKKLTFFHMTDPAISRKRSIVGRAVKSEVDLRVVNIEALGQSISMYDISTGTEDFIANGVVSHNCYARPSHAYMDLSPGLDFESRIFFKPNAAELLEKALRKPGYQCSPIALGTNTDPYQPLEREKQITRQLLETMQRFQQPVTIVTKSQLILRDLPILKEMAQDGLAQVAISVTTLDNELKRKLEPRTAGPAARLRVLEQLSSAGIPTAVLAAPMIPALNDCELEAILRAARNAGADHAAYILLRLPHEVAPLFRQWLEVHYPERAAHVMSIVQQSRGGRDYRSDFSQRQTGTGVFAQLLQQRFGVAIRKLGLNRRDLKLDNSRFCPPPQSGDQQSLF